MNAQRYTPAQLDEIADQCRDEAIRLQLLGPAARTYADTYYPEIDTLVGLATLLRKDAEAGRRTARAVQRDGQESAG
jgi:hypothetical protein